MFCSILIFNKMIADKSFLAAILLILLSSLNSSGQFNEYRFTNIDAGNGLPENQCRVIFQDVRGLIWIGTVNGLVRYDGINFVSFKNDMDDSTSLSNNTVKAILEDKYHQLWIGTEEGLNLYRSEKNNFVIFKNNPQNTKSLSNDNVNSFYLDKRGDFWICTENGLNLLNYKDKTFTQFIKDNNNPDILPGENIEKVCDANSGKLWVASNRGLGLFDPASSKSANYRLGNSSNKLSEWIDDVLIDKKNRLWIAVSNGGLYRVDDVKTFNYVHYINHPFDNKSLLDNYVIRIKEDHESNIWIGTYEGLNLFDEKNNCFIRFLHDDLNEYSLNGRFVFSVFEDNQQSLWIPTFRGISYYSKYQNQFNLLQNFPKNRSSSVSNEVRSIYRTNNNELLIGYILKGFEVYDKNNRLIEHFEHDPNVQASVINNNINAILEDNDKRIWIGTLGGLSLFNRNTKTFRNFTFNPNDTTSLGNNGVFGIYMDSNNQLWICTWGGGLCLYDRSKNKFIRYFTHKPFTDADKFVKTILETHDGTLWIGNNDGLKIFNQKENSLKYFRHSVSDRNSLSSNYIQTIFEDSKNRLWIGTTTGLNLMTDAKGSFKAYTEKDGLPSNIIYGILEDKLGRLWLSTSNGLCCFTPPTEGKKAIFRNYVKYDGIQSNQFAEGSYFIDKRNGEMFFGGTNGLTYFIPEKISDNPYKPQIIFTRLLLSNKPVRIGEAGSPLKVEFNQTEELILNNSQASVFTIEFSALNYINPEKNQFSYILEGFDKEWLYIGNKSSVTYTNLSHGEYYFRIKAANNHGVWNEVPRVLKIVILPPWWKTK